MVDNQEYFEQQRRKRANAAKKAISDAVNLTNDDNQNLDLLHNETEDTYLNKKDKKLSEDETDSTKLVSNEAEEREKQKAKRKGQVAQTLDFIARENNERDRFQDLTDKIDNRKQLKIRKEKKYQDDIIKLREQRQNCKSDAERRDIDNKINNLTSKHFSEMQKIDNDIQNIQTKRAGVRHTSLENKQKAINEADNYIQEHRQITVPNNYGDNEKKREEDKQSKKADKDEGKLNKSKQRYSKAEEKAKKKELKAQRKEERRFNSRAKNMAKAQKNLSIIGDNTSSSFVNRLFTKSTGGKGLNSAIGNALKNGAKGILRFIVCHPVLVVCFCLFSFWLASVTTIDNTYKNPYDQISVDTIEYNAWTEAFNDVSASFLG